MLDLQENKIVRRARYLYYGYRRKDMEKGFETAITPQWIKENIFTSKCIYCGEEDWAKLGCDRIDNTKGHTPDNIVCACKKCNSKRSAKDFEWFLENKRAFTNEEIKEHNRIRGAAYRETHKEKIKNDAKAYWENNKDYLKEYKKAWGENNKEKNKAKKKIYYQTHKEEIKAYREAHKEELRLKQKAYREAHKEKIKAYMKEYDKNRYEARKKENIQ